MTSTELVVIIFVVLLVVIPIVMEVLHEKDLRENYINRVWYTYDPKYRKRIDEELRG